MRGISLAVAASLVLAACATPTMPYLNAARQHCSEGDQHSCNEIPGLQAQVNAEQSDQAAKVAGGLLLGLTAVAAGAAAGYAASQPHYDTVVVVCRPYWSC
jgi:hypothetical protein